MFAEDAIFDLGGAKQVPLKRPGSKRCCLDRQKIQSRLPLITLPACLQNELGNPEPSGMAEGHSVSTPNQSSAFLLCVTIRQPISAT